MSRGPAFDSENLTYCFGVVRICAQSVHRFCGERDEIARTQCFDGFLDFCL